VVKIIGSQVTIVTVYKELDPLSTNGLFQKFSFLCSLHMRTILSIVLNMGGREKEACGMVKMAGPELAVAPMHRICKKAGADRVSESAAKELAKVLDEIGVKIAREAMDYAMHAGRKTIKSEDIEIAARKVLGR
jgi:histone H3/H4